MKIKKLNAVEGLFALWLALCVIMSAFGCGGPSRSSSSGDGGGGDDDDDAAASSSSATGTGGSSGSGCVPATCASEGKDCGEILDGCGNTLSCGTCSIGQTCGGSGTPNVCGIGTCSPKTCAAEGKDCGSLSDGCGALLDCGTCPAGQTCGGGGVENVCADGPCTPTTCEAEGAECGVISDQCGGQLSCGMCASPGVCGGGGTPNVCSIPCPSGCPDGYTCNMAGVCVGGAPNDLLLDVKAHLVSGLITLNGAQPMSGCSSADRAYVHFDDAAKGYHFQIPVPCNGGSTPFTYSGYIYSGTYKVSVVGGLSELPAVPFVANPALVVSADIADLNYDVKAFSVSGLITLNGAQPTSGCSSADRAYVHFDDDAKGYHFQLPVPCNGGSTPFTYSGFVYPGTYKVSVAGGLSNLPSVPFLANPSLVINANAANLNYDVKAFSVSGLVTLNGAQPTSGCSSADRAYVHFDDAAKNYHFQLAVPCNGGSTPFTYSGYVYAGTYKVSVAGGLSELPSVPFLSKPSLVVSANIANLDHDVVAYAVSGLVTLNGAQPMSGCSSADRAYVHFDDAQKSYYFQIPVPCNGGSTPFTFSGFVYAGVYRVGVSGGLSNLPSVQYIAIEKIQIP
jgi:hypothetical protein